MSNKTINHAPLTNVQIEQKNEAQLALNKMKELEKKKKKKMITIKKKNGTVISSTSVENLNLYKDGR